MKSGKMLLSILKARRITQTEAYCRLGKSQSAFASWIKCRSIIPYKEVKNIRDTFGLGQVDYLNLLSAVQKDVIERWEGEEG